MGQAASLGDARGVDSVQLARPLAQGVSFPPLFCKLMQAEHSRTAAVLGVQTALGLIQGSPASSSTHDPALLPWSQRAELIGFVQNSRL